MARCERPISAVQTSPLLQRQGRVKRVRLEQCESRVGQLPDIGRQRLIAFPKLRQGKGLETHRYYWPLPIGTDSPRRICALTWSRRSMPAPSGEKSRSIWESHSRRSRSASQARTAICSSVGSVSIACWISLRPITVSYLFECRRSGSPPDRDTTLTHHAQIAELASALRALQRPLREHPIESFGRSAETALQLCVFGGGKHLAEARAGAVAGRDQVGAGDQRR